MVAPEHLEISPPIRHNQLLPAVNSSSGPMKTASSTAAQLREGLTVIVSIITDTRQNVILVPSAAINISNGQETVMVILSDGTTEERVITTGLNDWQNTEVLSGLSEGEQVLVPEGTSTASNSSQQRGPNTIGGGFIIPGGR